MRRSKRALKQARTVAALDADCRKRVVEDRDHNTCQRCGKQQGEWDSEVQRPVNIQWAHVHTRDYHVTRWEEDNSLALCDRDHKWFDNHKVLSYEWFRKRWPERWENIQNVLNSGAKVKAAWLLEELRGKA
jgi:hypothetical protein